MTVKNSELANPVLQAHPRFSRIWFVPILALLIGLGMLLHQWQNQGLSIEVSFETAEGLEAGKTKLKYRNLDIGVVESISFNDDQSKVLVAITIDKSMRPLLRSDTLFWVVRPRVGAGGLSGIGTLVSGAYIQISPGVATETSNQYTGEELPPVTSPSTPGIHLTLTYGGGKSLKEGNPLIYRGFEVGRVEQIKFDTETRAARYRVFIDAPYDSLVTTNTFFWHVGGASLSASSTGVSVDIASVETLLSGGLEFDVPEDLTLGKRVSNEHEFQLYDSKTAVIEGRKYRFIEYLVLVEDSVGGLDNGASVEYRGIRIGTVERVQIAFDAIAKQKGNAVDHRIPVLIRIEPERVVPAAQFEEFKQQFDRWIIDGLTATIETANFLTGTLKISMDADGQKREQLDKVGSLTVIPSTPGGFANITEKLESVLAKVDALPLETTVERVNKALSSVDQTLAALEKTLAVTEVTLDGVRPPADLYESVSTTLKEFERTLNKVQPLIQELSNQPNALIFSGKKPQDKEPKAKRQD